MEAPAAAPASSSAAEAAPPGSCDDAAPAAPGDDGGGGDDDGADLGEFVTVATSDQLCRDDARLHAEVHGRHLALVRRGAQLYAMDATCYHMGGPLLHADIEDVPGHGACIVCPWHHYQISMTTGERLYQDMKRKAGPSYT